MQRIIAAIISFLSSDKRMEQAAEKKLDDMVKMIDQRNNEKANKMNMKKVAIVVGHSSSSQGAGNKNSEVREWSYNNNIAKKLKIELGKDMEVVILQRVTNYSELPYQINAEDPDLIISLHCNAFDGKASGCEMLHYHKSLRSKIFADLLQKEVVHALGNKNRGIRPNHSEDRGGHLLKNTDAPCVITEPFFIDNDKELSNAISKEKELVEAYANAVHLYFTV